MGRSGKRRFMTLRPSSPFMPGMLTSSIARSNGTFLGNEFDGLTEILCPTHLDFGLDFSEERAQCIKHKHMIIC